MSVISLRLEEKENALIREYAKANNLSVSELIRGAVLEKIEDTMDIQAYEAYLSKGDKQKLYTLEEVEKELQLS